MKYQIISILLLIAFLSLSACSAQKPSEQSPSTLQDPSLSRPQDRGDYFIETEDCFYYLYTGNWKVYFSSKNDPGFYLLCNKPDCPHNGEDCNAHAEGGLGYWNGHLYSTTVLSDSAAVFRMNLDGSEHSEIAKLELPIDSNGMWGGSYFFFFHGHYLYYYIVSTPCSFFRVDLESGKTERLFQEYFQDGSRMFEFLRFDGGDMYFLAVRPSGKRMIYRYEIESGLLEPVCDWWENEPDNWMIKDGMVYYYSRERHTFCEYDLGTETLKEYPSQSSREGAAYYDRDYIYLVTWEREDMELKSKSFSVYDRATYRFLTEMPLLGDSEFLYTSETTLFFTSLPSCKVTHYLPKSSIGSGELELLPLPDPYSYR